MYTVVHTEFDSRVFRDTDFLVYAFHKFSSGRDAKAAAEDYANFCNKNNEANHGFQNHSPANES